ncbi:hydroperoxide isomerase ALOXE3-like isoform X2 [Hyperolius riggenbachi]|uniref:hydroperoxide isomerase ALOXE3-like isoform X2 n=1 Tax=Hyperolius riggenbachi TaxID=752182 RepID=UPI0035A38341
MGTYKLQIATGTDLSAGTCDNVSVVLVGVQGESDKHQLPRHWSNFQAGAASDFEINVQKDLGELLLVRLSTERYKTFNMDAWYCRYVNVTSPAGHLNQFPVYTWIPSSTSVEIPEGKGQILSEDLHPLLQEQRKAELLTKREAYKWKVYAEGLPQTIDVTGVNELPPNEQFSYKKLNSFQGGLQVISSEFMADGFLTCTESWTDLNDIKLVAFAKKSKISEVVAKMWKEDSFFGYQYLNGNNPMVIKKCLQIPENFPVSDCMVAHSLGSSTSLQKEMQGGNIFLADYKFLQDIPANKSVNGKQQYVAAPMCLLWKNPQDQLVPIAIQLSQIPGENSPIFLPSDNEYDWLLAKMWVRNSEFHIHELVTHYNQVHLLAGTFSVATNRQLPMSHPVYKMMIPQLRFTLNINILSLDKLVGAGGVFDQATSLDRNGAVILQKKAMKEVTYSSLFFPDDIQARGLETVPNYLYRDDGMKVWAAIESFVSSVVNHYYTSDEMVRGDPELQAWVAEIFTKGFQERESSEIPSSLETKVSLIKYLTMVIFRCSAQHSAVGSSQFDFFSWTPNGPSTMKSPPPTAKGVTTMKTILATLPDVNTSAFIISYIWLLSVEPEDRRRLGNYPDVRFIEEEIQKSIKVFQDKLAEISKYIQKRNESLPLPYPYLDPDLIENSVSV